MTRFALTWLLVTLKAAGMVASYFPCWLVIKSYLVAFLDEHMNGSLAGNHSVHMISEFAEV